MNSGRSRSFRKQYQALHDAGLADCPGGREYRRVRKWWVAIGEPAAGITPLIVAIANAIDGVVFLCHRDRN